MRLLLLVFALAVVVPSFLFGADREQLARAFAEGQKLNAKEAQQSEDRLQKKPTDLLERTKLLAFYTFGKEIATEDAVAGRRRHILWLAEFEPDHEIWDLRSYAMEIHRSGGRLPDPEGFEVVAAAWKKHLASKRHDAKLRDRAANFLELGDRETATTLIREMKNPRYLGSHFASVLLGITARDFNTGLALACDPRVRDTPLARELLAELETASDPQLLGGAGFILARQGAALWSLGETGWDYSSLAKRLLQRAQELDPTTLDWFLANPKVPQPGELRGIGQIRVGGNVLADRCTKMVQPSIAPEGVGVRGVVRLNIAIGGDGKVIKAIPVSGPQVHFANAVDAVEQWEYRPTTINGQPVAVISVVEITYK